MSFDKKQNAYISFREIVAEKTSSIVAWIGSGLSVPAGLPTWAKLRDSLIETLNTTIDSYEEPDRTKARTKYEAIRKTKDYWLAFQMLEDELGQTTFRESIRRELQTTPRIAPPETYKKLWHLGISGLINLNLDRLATRAYSQEAALEPLEYSGFQVANAAGVLKQPNPFILNLHGHHEDSSTWVLTKRQLNALLNKGGYQDFITACFMSRTILFTGLSPDDISVGSHLERLRKTARDVGPHFWITDRRDSATNKWAEEHQIRVIRYSAFGGNHSELDELFRDLLSFIPSDTPAPPVALTHHLSPAKEELPPPEILAEKDTDKIRQLLNAHVQSILTETSPDAYQRYENFCELYDEAIYRAWYTSDQSGRNHLLNYTLERRAERGAFGTVYQAVADSGEEVAVKVLHEDVRKDAQMLQSFRRGVRSMRILSEASITGMVPYLDASEIPAFVVMKWIDGPNLHEAVSSGYLNDWLDRLKVASRLAEIIKSAHLLPQRVLHRDIRPPNVMLEGYYTDPDNYRIVVLDFDLSWHIGASEKSVVYGNTTTGYLAPEQIKEDPSASTRHASVDSFGLGMSLYYIVSGRDPFPTQHEHTTWIKDLHEVCNARKCETWVSLPNRFARLIRNCTKSHQSSRWDLSQIAGELERLQQAIINPSSVDSADLLAEEIIARSNYHDSYSWDENKIRAKIKLPSGLTLITQAYDPDKLVYFRVEWSSTGQHSHRRVSKWLPDATNRAESMLKKSGWSIDKNYSPRQIQLVASKSTSHVCGSLAHCVDDVNQVGNEFNFS